MRIVFLSNDRDGADATAMIAGLAVALRSEHQHVLVLDPDPRTPLVRKSASPSLGHSLMRAFTDAHLPYDHVLFHCLSSFRGLTMTALAAADMAWLPASSPDALDDALRTIAMVERSRGQTLPALIVPMVGASSRGLNPPHRCSQCTVWNETVPSVATPIAASAALLRLASWLLGEGAAAVRDAQPAGLAAA